MEGVEEGRPPRSLPSLSINPPVNPDDRRGRKKATLLHTVENSFSFKFALAADLTGNRSSVERGLKGIRPSMRWR